MSIYVCTIFYQHSRYHAGTPGYEPQWDGEKWVPEPGKFTCVDFTKETIGFFKSFGIVSFQVIGTDKYNSSLAHSWVGIPFGDTILHFEPQDLVLFDPKDEYINIHVNYNSYQ